MTIDYDDVEVCRECEIQHMFDQGHMDEELGFICEDCYHEEAFTIDLEELSMKLSEKRGDKYV